MAKKEPLDDIEASSIEMMIDKWESWMRDADLATGLPGRRCGFCYTELRENEQAWRGRWSEAAVTVLVCTGCMDRGKVQAAIATWRTWLVIKAQRAA